MLDDSDRLLGTIEQVLRTGRLGARQPCNRTRSSGPRRGRARLRRARSRNLHRVTDRMRCSYEPSARAAVLGDPDEVKRRHHQPGR